MKLYARDPETGKETVFDIVGLDDLAMAELSSAACRDAIDQIDIGADAKALLEKLARTTLRVGDLVIRIGRRILEVAFALIKRFPSATAGLIIGALVGGLAGAIPVLGMLLGPLVTPLVMAFGLAYGGLKDINDASVRAAVRDEIASFNALKS